jgi:uncharacterized membrane protein
MKHWHAKHKERMSPGDHAAEWTARRIGSTPSIIAHTLAFLTCFGAVYLRAIGLTDLLLWLTTIVSLEAIYIGLFLQNSSNRHGDESEANAQNDAETNLAAKEEIEDLQKAFIRMDNKLDALLSTRER